MSVETQQVEAYQLDLFDEAQQKASRPDATGDSGTGSGAFEVHQAFTAWDQQRTLTRSLMDQVVRSSNLEQAYKRVKANQGSAGVDGMRVSALKTWLSLHRGALVRELLEGRYHPQPVKRVEIAKPGGGVRELGIPTVVDRLVQQAVLQVLQPIFDPTFSGSSFGFRPGLSVSMALDHAERHVMEGYQIAVDIDLSRFFDRVNHDMVMARLARLIGDKRVLKLVRRFLEAGLMRDGVCMKRTEGTPQGGPLSPLLANLLLDDFDKELEARGHRFCRYADDATIYVRSQAAGERVMASATKFLEGRLHLKVNKEKSAVAPVWSRSFLGHRFLRTGGRGIAPQSLKRVKDKLRRLTGRSRGKSLKQVIHEINTYMTGWVIFFGQAKCRTHLHQLDKWVRRRLRCYRIKQCKRIKPLVDFLKAQGVPAYRAWQGGASSRGWWCTSNIPPVNAAMPAEWFYQQGLMSFVERYDVVKTNGNRRGT